MKKQSSVLLSLLAFAAPGLVILPSAISPALAQNNSPDGTETQLRERGRDNFGNMNRMSPSQPSMDQNMNPMNPSTSIMNPMNAPRVLDSGSLGRYNHQLKIATGDRTITSMMIRIPREVQDIRDIDVSNSGNDIVADTQMGKMGDDRTVMINFNQPVPPGTEVEVNLDGVQYSTPFNLSGGSLEYAISINEPGTTQSIPLGFTRVRVTESSNN